MKRIYTSEEILALEDLYQLQEDSANRGYPEYMLTHGEVEWWQFVFGKYSISDYMDEFTYEDDYGNLILKLDAEAMGKALTEDGMFPKAVCLSDDTALQRIFFWCAMEQEGARSELLPNRQDLFKRRPSQIRRRLDHEMYQANQ